MGIRKALVWLGEHEWVLPSSEQRRRFYSLYDDLPEDTPHRDAALAAAAGFLAGDLDVEDIGRGLAASRQDLEACFASARTVGRLAVGAGMAEARVADALGVDRMTLRKWQGKR